MATIRIRRQSYSLYADGSRVDHPVEENHNWPMMTCQNFKNTFPAAVVWIKAEELDHAHDTHHSYAREPRQNWSKRERPDAHTPIPLIHSPAMPDMSGAAAINAAVAKMRA